MKVKNHSNIVILEDDRDLLELLGSFFRQKGYNVHCFEDARLALIEIENNRISVDVIITDLKMPQMTGLDFIKSIKKFNSTLPIILMTAEGSVEIAIEAIEIGAYDFVLKPLHIPQLLISVQRALHLYNVQNENLNLKSMFSDQDQVGLKGAIGKSLGFKNAIDMAKRVSNSTANVIVYGESGSGKEVVARAVHELGNRKNGPFIAINCSAIPENLLESELFGYVKGAFTGAVGNKVGLFEEANKGTIFLDEIGDMALTLQAKLLRVLQERKIKRIGENQSREISCRVICATHKDLKSEVEKGNFREDLYFRLNVIPISMPPLRERVEDIIPLSEFFLKKFNILNLTNIKGFSRDAIFYLENNPWKGNVRELENAIERAVVLCCGQQIEIDDLPPMDRIVPNKSTKIDLEDISQPIENKKIFGVERVISIEELNKEYIEFVFKRNEFAKEVTAKELGIDRKTLYRKLKEMNYESRDEYLN